MGIIDETLVINGTRQAEEDLRRVAGAAGTASTAMHAAGQAGHSASGGMASIAQQMPDVISQLSSGTGALQVFTQQGLQVVQSNQALLASLSSMMPALAALGVAAAALSTAFFRLNESTIEQQQAADVAAEASQNLANWMDIQRGAAIELATATGQLSAAEGDRARNAIQAQKAWLQSTEELRAKAAEMRRAQDSLTTQAVDFATGVLDVVDVAGVWSAALDMATDSSADLQRNIDAVNKVVGQQTEQARTTTEVLNKSTDAKRAATTASREHAAALDDEKRADQERQQALEGYITVQEYWMQMQAGVTIDPRAAPNATMGTLLGGTATLGGGGLGSAGMLSSMSGAMKGIGGGDLGGIGGIIKQLLGGGITGLLNVVLPPPWGQIAAALVGLLSGGGAGAVKTMLGGVVDAVLNVLTGLPELLMTLLDSDFLPGMIISIIEALPMLVEGILAGAGELLVDLVAMLPDLARAFQQVIPDLVAALITGIGILVIDIIQAIMHIPQGIVESIRGFGSIEGASGFRGMGDTWGAEWRKQNVFSRGNGGGNITVNGMVGDRVGLAAGIRGLFDGDFGRAGGRF